MIHSSLHYPKWTVFFGFVVGMAPMFLVPAAAIVKYCRLKKTGEVRHRNLFIGNENGHRY